LFIAWLTLLPNWTVRPVNSHFLDMGSVLNFGRLGRLLFLQKYKSPRRNANHGRTFTV
jgi:hypothetical protein